MIYKSDDEFVHIGTAAAALTDKLARIPRTPAHEVLAKRREAEAAADERHISAKKQIADMTERLNDMESRMKNPMLLGERRIIAGWFVKLYDERERFMDDYALYLRDQAR